MNQILVVDGRQYSWVQHMQSANRYDLVLPNEKKLLFNRGFVKQHCGVSYAGGFDSSWFFRVYILDTDELIFDPRDVDLLIYNRFLDSSGLKASLDETMQLFKYEGAEVQHKIQSALRSLVERHYEDPERINLEFATLREAYKESPEWFEAKGVRR